MIGLINFAHSDPLYGAFPDKSLVVRDTPKNLISRILDGELKCGMVSLVEYIRNRDKLELVESATIRSSREVISAILVSRKAGIEAPLRISVTEHTRTTEFYTEMILRKLKIPYELIHSREREASKLLDEAEYALVIGDEALRVYSTGFRIIWDIGFEFNARFSMVPVFSVTVRRKGVDCSTEIRNLNEAINNSGKFIEAAVKENMDRLNLPESILKLYYNRMRYDFIPDVARTIEFLSGALTSNQF
ncbi:MAG: ABC transporter substrate-binding protein [Candidatus Thermoplasmatota archaeon]|nr:ABC transporter substrate-binding protein [Candidatus Thermoplasmatota archaeon]